MVATEVTAVGIGALPTGVGAGDCEEPSASIQRRHATPSRTAANISPDRRSIRVAVVPSNAASCDVTGSASNASRSAATRSVSACCRRMSSASAFSASSRAARDARRTRRLGQSAIQRRAPAVAACFTTTARSAMTTVSLRPDGMTGNATDTVRRSPACTCANRKSGSSSALLHRRPLRTVRESFPSYGSSLSKPAFASRLHHL